MTAGRAPTADEARVAAVYADVLTRVDLLAEQMAAGDWVAACDQARRLSMLVDRLVDRMTAPTPVDGQLVRSAACLTADAGLVLQLARNLTGTICTAIRALHPERTEATR